MKIVRERPCARRYHRVNAPLNAVLPWGERKTATHWSLGGARFDGLSGPLPDMGDIIELILELPFQGFDISFEVPVSIVSVKQSTGALGVEYVELSERAQDLLTHFIDDLVRGKMATVEDTICRIDVPVTPISTKPDPSPEPDAIVRRWPIKTIFFSAFYLALGLVVFGYLGILIYSSTMRLEVKSAVVSAPLTTLKMPVDGKIVPVRFEIGTAVRRGDTIARIENSKLTADLEEKRIELQQSRDLLARAREKFRIQSSRMKLYQVVKQTDRKIASAQVEAAREALTAADNNYERMSTLRAKGLVNALKFDKAKSDRAQVEARLKKAEYELERASTLDAVSERVFFNNKEFVADLDMLALEVDAASAGVRIALMQLQKVENAAADLVIEAPFDGRIITVTQTDNANVLRNQPIVTLEKSEDLTVKAYLTQDEALSVGLNERAKVFLPGLGRHLEAVVVKVDRASNFIDVDKSRYDWSDRTERTARVSLKLNLTVPELQNVTAGLPAVVIFPKRFTNDVYHRIGMIVRKLIQVDHDTEHSI